MTPGEAVKKASDRRRKVTLRLANKEQRAREDLNEAMKIWSARREREKGERLERTFCNQDKVVEKQCYRTYDDCENEPAGQEEAHVTMHHFLFDG